jgi:hypothetical protein
MDATRPGAVLARHAGTGEKTGQLTPDDDDGEPRRPVISSGFYAVYQSAGKKAGGLVSLYCPAFTAGRTSAGTSCGPNHGKPPADPDLERFLPWHAGPRRPPRPGTAAPARITAPEQPL